MKQFSFFKNNSFRILSMWGKLANLCIYFKQVYVNVEKHPTTSKYSCVRDFFFPHGSSPNVCAAKHAEQLLGEVRVCLVHGWETYTGAQPAPSERLLMCVRVSAAVDY